MSAFVEPGSDTSEPSLAELLSLWSDLPDWRKAQFLGLHRLERGVRYPVSALLDVASVAELISEARRLSGIGVDADVESARAWNSSQRHVVLEWPPQGRLALIWQEMRAEAQTSLKAESR